MEHLNVFVFYVLGQTLDNCRLHVNANAPLSLYSGSVGLARTALTLLMEGGAKYRLKESSQSAANLVAALERIQACLTGSPSNEVLSQDEANRFSVALSSFDSAINLELGRAPIFWVKPKGAFDTSVMISRASLHFTDAIHQRLPKEAIDDTDHAGRCIAFSLGTAAGFHIARATEAVIKKYMTVCGCPSPKDSQRNWGHYIRSLTEHGANKKVVAHLEQIKDLHRNPLIHPEVHLGLGEAVTLFSVCTSAIHGMVADMEIRQGVAPEEAAAVLPREDEEGEPI